MTARYVPLDACVAALLALGAGASFAASGPVNVAAANPQPIAVCPADSGAAHRRAGAASTPNRIAFKCRCCGRDENGHCNHQCCTD